MRYLKNFNESITQDIKTFTEEALINLIDNGAVIYTKESTLGINTNIDIQFGKRTKWVDVKDDIIRYLELIDEWGINHIYISLISNTIVVNKNSEKNIKNLISENWAPETYFSSIQIFVKNPRRI